MPISPNIAMMMEQQGTTALSKEFASSFSTMAYDLIGQQLPELLNSIVTFKILDTDPGRDFGLGTFVLLYQDVPLYVPVIMQSSELKPLELLYYKDADMFLPLSEDWVKQIVSKRITEFGDAVNRPQDVPTDVNLEELITPPRTGRYVYASELFNLEKKPAEKQVAKLAADNALTLQLIKERLPAAYVNKLAAYMKTNVKILNKLASTQNEDFLDGKNETAPPPKGKIDVIDLRTPAKLVNEKFAQEEKQDLARQIVEDGFVLKDNRDPESLGMTPVRVHGKLKCEQVTKSDFYQLFGKNGKVHDGFYFDRPLFIHDSDRMNEIASEPLTERPHISVPEKGIFINTKKEPFHMYQNPRTTPVVGIIEEDPKERENILTNIFSGAKKRPSVGEFGVFVNMETTPYTITEPTYIKQVFDIEGTTRIGISKYEPEKRTPNNEFGGNSWERQQSFEDKNPDQIWLADLKTALQKYDKSGIVALDRKEWQWLPLQGRDWGTLPCERAFVTSPKFIEDFIQNQIRERGGDEHKVVKDDLGMFSIDEGKPLDKKEAALKLAYDLRIPASDALNLIKVAQQERKVTFFLFEKTASIFAVEQPEQVEMPPQPSPEEMMASMPPENMEINPQYMDAAQQLDNQGLFNISTLISLNKRQLVRNIFKDYFGTFKDAIDALGRVLYTLWVKEPDLINELSLEGYQEIEDNVRLLFKGLGDLLLTTSKDSEILTL